jgi:predicted nuclease of restriction endonuclease-like (RecB) superfamily
MKAQELALYRDLLGDIKQRLRQARNRAALSANAEMLLLYWDIGRMIAIRQKREGWGAGVIPRLSVDLKNELPEQKGFSERNIKRMLRFYHEYSDTPAKVPQSVALLEQVDNQEDGIVPQPEAQMGPLFTLPIVQQSVALLPWGHNVLLFEKIPHLPTRLWYARQALEQGWSRDTLTAQIKARAHERQGAAVTNFAATLPAAHAAIAQGLLKDPYLFDCQAKDRIFAEYALRDIHKPIGVASYELTRALPKELASSLPSIEDIEAEMAASIKEEG